jgi:hypothetical protein
MEIMPNIMAIVPLNTVTFDSKVSQTWTEQTVNDSSKQRFMHLSTSESLANTLTNMLTNVDAKIGESSAGMGLKSSWHDVLGSDILGRDALIREVNTMGNLSIEKQAVASAKIMLMSLDTNLRTQTIHDGSKNLEESIKGMLHG